MKRTATAIWKGSGKDGKGTLTTQSNTLNNTQYSYKSRFEEGVGTNPEELVAAAHAGCFAMALSFQLQAMGITPDSLECECGRNIRSTHRFHHFFRSDSKSKNTRHYTGTI